MFFLSRHFDKSNPAAKAKRRNSDSEPVPRSRQNVNLLLQPDQTNLTKKHDKEGPSRNEKPTSANNLKLKKTPDDKQNHRSEKYRPDRKEKPNSNEENILDVNSGELAQKNEPGKKTKYFYPVIFNTVTQKQCFPTCFACH